MFAKALDEIKETAARAIPEEISDRRDESGLLICGNCGTHKETKVSFLGVEKVVRCLCKCAKEADDRERAEFAARQEMIKINNMRSAGIQDKKILSYTFANDDGKNAKVSNLARRYVDKFAEMQKENCGLLLYGDTGTGKSFVAGCIGNALIDKGVSVFATSVTRLINQIFSAGDVNALLKDLCRYELLIIDDIGAQRGTDYATEQVYTIIDERYKSNKPIIFTTNTDPQTFSSEQDIQYRRIYDRILEMCVPIKVEGQRRKAAGQAKAKIMSKILYGDA